MSEPDDRDDATASNLRVPPRWLDESASVPDDLVKGLQALRDRRPSPAQLAVIAAPFALASSAAADALASGSSGAAAPSSSAAVLAKIFGVAVASGGLGLLVWLGVSHRAGNSGQPEQARESLSAASAPARPSDSATPSAAAARGPRLASPAIGGASASPLETPEPTTVSQDVSLPSPAIKSPIEQPGTPSMPRTQGDLRAPAKASAPPVATGSVPTYTRPAQGSEQALLSETQLLAQARSAEPARALELAKEHERRFPASAFVQEREYLIITAFVRAGNRSAAERRARQFARSYPQSPYLARLQSLVPTAIGAD